MPTCLSMSSHRLRKFCLKLLTTTVSHSWYDNVVGMTVLQITVATLPFLCYQVLLCVLQMGTSNNCKRCWPFGEYCQRISQPPFHLFKFLYRTTRMLLRAKRATADLYYQKVILTLSSIDSVFPQYLFHQHLSLLVMILHYGTLTLPYELLSDQLGNLCWYTQIQNIIEYMFSQIIQNAWLLSFTEVRSCCLTLFFLIIQIANGVS